MKRRFRVTDANAEDIKAMIEQITNARVLSIKIVGEFAEVEMEESVYDEPILEEAPWDDECVMCGKERQLNLEGYCSQCWQIWNS